MTRTTTQTANRALLGAEVTLAIVGTVITAAAVSSAVKACPRGNPDTCDLSKATGWLAGVATAPFLISTAADLALSGGTERSTRMGTADAIESEHIEECGRQPEANVRAKLTLPDAQTLERTSSQDGSLLFELTRDQVARFGANFGVELSVEGAAPQSISVRVPESRRSESW